MKEEERFPLHRGGRPGRVREKAVPRVVVAHNPAWSGGRRWSEPGSWVSLSKPWISSKVSGQPWKGLRLKATEMRRCRME